MTRIDRTDFERFARAEMDGLLRYAVVLCGDPDLARDLVQDVLIKAYERWPVISAKEHPRAYVRTMVTNAFLSWRRRWSVRHIETADVLVPPPVSDHAVGITERDDVLGRLALLPRRQRAVIVLRFYEQLADADIAVILGCPVGTVRSLASRALAALRTQGDSSASDGSVRLALTCNTD